MAQKKYDQKRKDEVIDAIVMVKYFRKEFKLPF